MKAATWPPVLPSEGSSMPARSTPFQRLVFQIQTQLSPGCEVKESELLKSLSTGALREVDVVVRSTVGEHTIAVSIECIERAKRADIAWVEQMLKKHEDLDGS